MKKIIILTAFYLTATLVSAQNTAFIDFYNKYSGNTDFTIVSVNERMISLFSNFEVEGEEEKAVMDAVSKLKGIKLIANQKTTQGKQLFTEAQKSFNKGYDELMTVRDGDSDMRFLIKEKDGIINELIMLVGSDSSFVAASIFGNIDLKQMSKIAKGLNISGMENLEKLEDMDEDK